MAGPKKPDAGALLVLAPQLASEFGVCLRTLDRWLASSKLGLPTPVVINHRRYFVRAETDAWKDARLRAALSAAE